MAHSAKIQPICTKTIVVKVPEILYCYLKKKKNESDMATTHQKHRSRSLNRDDTIKLYMIHSPKKSKLRSQSAYSLGTSKWWKRQNLTENFKWKKEALLMLPPKLLLCHWKIAIWTKLKRSYGILKNHNFEGTSFLTVTDEEINYEAFVYEFKTRQTFKETLI